MRIFCTLVFLLSTPGCALVADVQNMALLSPTLVDDYSAARVRVFRVGAHCRIEVALSNQTLVTALTKCTSIPTRVSP
jgi:hypothetical protein